MTAGTLTQQHMVANFVRCNKGLYQQSVHESTPSSDTPVSRWNTTLVDSGLMLPALHCWRYPLVGTAQKNTVGLNCLRSSWLFEKGVEAPVLRSFQTLPTAAAVWLAAEVTNRRWQRRMKQHYFTFASAQLQNPASKVRCVGSHSITA